MQGITVNVSERQVVHLLQVWEMYLAYVEDEPFNPANRMSSKERNAWEDRLYAKLRALLANLEREKARQNHRDPKPWRQETLPFAQVP